MPSTLRRDSRRIVSLAAQIAIGVSVIQLTSVVAAPNQIAAYGLEEGNGTTVADASGNNYGGTLKNGPTWTVGKYNGGLAFDGSNDHVTFGDVAAANGLSA